ncbi:MBL fold metallo-hydrolase [Thermoclostridium stercorarium]|nr:MBL fold metallo-hydrolase [Thermoclostridium stercorarium]
MKKKVDVWYLYHSGFAVKMNNKLLIFDYFVNQAANNETVLYNGKFSPECFKDTDVYFFVSHRHYDHYNPIIFRWVEQNPNIRLIISSDIADYTPHPNIHRAEPENEYVIDGLYIETFTSTDEGTAFLVKTDGVCLFHAGDLHWWHWEGEPDSFNRQMEKQFKEQIRKLARHKIDIAFIVTDPRQENFSLLGLEWFVNEVDCAHIFPMHFSDDYSIMDRIRKFMETNRLKSEIHLINRRGQCFNIEI